ncbi:LysE family translocator [Poseidonibacter ostreae]|jgi:threonine/homoserine/homoserine lactone efflux protein|uniref:LysE family translocator n=1 Tax=Poseidonibacter ostreae TaxID=2654171 RepID=A0A6L4WVM5_9BACT|nr:LysE family translocator [Poseidonibacter ostreae]KAB7886504.1 LysE family translocator [Poseidonibacter ostreae]KAB7890647.1 LysE family translocator [Poseidonibacter ostreae]KAB7892370.1 LysE family translocator [Poseidonibacter ostreae]MAC83296.1 lysine transporter LysE [Arcobacter sp.]
MTLTILFTMISFSFAMSISPGPVNMMIITSGINNGFSKTFSFISGATIGFTFLLIVIALGLKTLLDEYPLFLEYLGYVGSLFIIYMGYKIASSTPNIELENSMKKLKFYEGFLLQWLNPKAWAACISGVAMYSFNDFFLLVFIIIYFIVCYLSLSFWGLFGQKATMFLNTNKKIKNFNLFMGSILIISTLVLLFINIL